MRYIIGILVIFGLGVVLGALIPPTEAPTRSELIEMNRILSIENQQLQAEVDTYREEQ